MPLQLLNNKYRKDLKKTYDISEEFDEELMNNKVYGVVTDGMTWIFLMYEHSFNSVKVRIVRQLDIKIKDFFNSLFEVTKSVINLAADLIFNKCT